MWPIIKVSTCNAMAHDTVVAVIYLFFIKKILKIFLKSKCSNVWMEVLADKLNACTQTRRAHSTTFHTAIPTDPTYKKAYCGQPVCHYCYL